MASAVNNDNSSHSKAIRIRSKHQRSNESTRCIRFLRLSVCNKMRCIHTFMCVCVCVIACDCMLSIYSIYLFIFSQGFCKMQIFVLVHLRGALWSVLIEHDSWRSNTMPQCFPLIVCLYQPQCHHVPPVDDSTPSAADQNAKLGTLKAGSNNQRHSSSAHGFHHVSP